MDNNDAIRSILLKTGDKLVETGHATHYLANSISGKGELRLTAKGLLLQASFALYF
jgi:hypothetical protein